MQHAAAEAGLNGQPFIKRGPRYAQHAATGERVPAGRPFTNQDRSRCRGMVDAASQGIRETGAACPAGASSARRLW